MAAKGNTFANDLLKLIFNGTPIPNLADNAASSPLTNLYLALHTADPGGAGNQTTSEIDYTSSARVAILRSTGGWVVTGVNVSPLADVFFPKMTGGAGGFATFATVGFASAGAGQVCYRGALDVPISITTGVPPIIPASAVITEA